MTSQSRQAESGDRRVHAALKDDWEVVRYDRAGKWYVEHPSPGRKRRAVSVAEAARITSEAMNRGEARLYLRRPGGRTFDRIVLGYA